MRRAAALLLAVLLMLTVPVCALAADSEEAVPEDRSGGVQITAGAMHGSIWQITVSGAGAAQTVKVPTWTDLNGQDDLVWYVAHRNNDGLWTVEIDTACHGGGRLRSHVYVDGRFAGGVAYEVPIPVWSGVLAIPADGSSYTILISNLRNASKVQVAAWSEAYGQDDLRWYNASDSGIGVWSVRIDTARHGGGDMVCHVYADDKICGGVSFSSPGAAPVVRTVLGSGTRYSIVVENLWGAMRVQVPTWGSAGGQGDMIWYNAAKTGSGTWRAEINGANHEEGTIESHVYADGRCIDTSQRVSRDFLTIRDQRGGSTSAPDPSSLSRKKIAWGSGGPLDSSGRPEGPVSYQNIYGGYDADFIAPASNRIYLTIDEGYENGSTAKILDVLRDKHVQAVFFVTYPFVQENPDLVRRMIEEGHQVGNHSTNHPSFPSVSLSAAFDEVMRTHRLVQQQFGYDMKLFRFPSGEYSVRDLALLQALGYRSVFWSFAYYDYEPSKQIGASAALKKVTNGLHPGAIYLLHAVSRDNCNIMGDFIDEARSRGYVFAPYDLT